MVPSFLLPQAHRLCSRPSRRMAKRSKDTLTGGSHDVNPQWMTGRVTQSAADVTTTAPFRLPRQVLPGAQGRALVMEVLRVWFDTPAGTTTAAAPAAYGFKVALTTKDFGTTSVPTDEPTLFAYHQKEIVNAFTAAGTFWFISNEPFVLDLTDGQGHGVLVATDSIFFQLNSITATGVINAATFKILYRWKEIGLAEYIGIVQSQQT